MVLQYVVSVIEHAVGTQFYLTMIENFSTSTLVFVLFPRREFPQQQIIMQPIFPITFTIRLTRLVVLDQTVSTAPTGAPGGMPTLFGKHFSNYQKFQKLKKFQKFQKLKFTIFLGVKRMKTYQLMNGFLQRCARISTIHQNTSNIITMNIITKSS